MLTYGPYFVKQPLMYTHAFFSVRPHTRFANMIISNSLISLIIATVNPYTTWKLFTIGRFTKQ